MQKAAHTPAARDPGAARARPCAGCEAASAVRLLASGTPRKVGRRCC